MDLTGSSVKVLGENHEKTSDDIDCVVDLDTNEAIEPKIHQECVMTSGDNPHIAHSQIKNTTAPQEVLYLFKIIKKDHSCLKSCIYFVI